eukprot:371562-Pleurochrysis_carterae.AAC.2
MLHVSPIFLTSEDGEHAMEVDDEYEPTEAEIADEEAEEPLMMQNAHHWDLFLEYVKEVQTPWAPPEADTNTYRKMRAQTPAPTRSTRSSLPWPPGFRTSRALSPLVKFFYSAIQPNGLAMLAKALGP